MDTELQTSRLERFQRLLQISSDLASTLDLNALLFRIVEAAADLCGAEAASILLYDRLKGELHFEMATNMDNPLLRGLVVPVDSSLAGWIVSNRQPVIIPDAQKDSRLFGAVGSTVNLSTHSLIGVPLLTKDKVIGVLEAINKRVGTFTDEDLSLLAALGGQAAVAIENSRLFQQSDLIAEMVHELRTPMASLNTAANLLGRQGISEAQRTRFIEIISAETNRLAELTTSFLDIARLESGRAQFHSEQVQIGPLVQSCIDVMQNRAAEKNITIEVQIPADLPLIIADSDKLKQVFLNLLSNAAKYNYPDGFIRITAGAQNGEIYVAVSDTGPGISAENMKNMFQKFYRVPGTEKLASGTGLGLSICKRIIEIHKGEIEVQSEVGKGTSFIVHLPLPKV